MRTRFALLCLTIILLGLASLAAPARATQSPTPTPTPIDPYAELTIEHLAGRFYGAGELTIQDTMATLPTFTRYLVSYPSDGLTIYGFMNVPTTRPGPYPVVIAVHGYVDPDDYDTLDYTTRYADALADAGFLVLHPNLRGYFPSNDGPNLFRVGMASDVLNLIGIVQQTGGLSGPLQQANPRAIGLWGHSMGGGISLRAITVNPSVRAAVLYGSMSGDEQQNYTKIFEWSDGTRGRRELDVPESTLQAIGAIHHLERIQAAVSIHHGENDTLVPLDWSIDLCLRLLELEKPVECYTYPGQPHTFYGEGDAQLIARTITFFDQHLRQRPETLP
ncbi:MAG: alpha/beta fold hydrolase [Chloroflexi bacterium]|nr:alpha/beta fold hydrolase [Chloroflexota bacterium]